MLVPCKEEKCYLDVLDSLWNEGMSFTFCNPLKDLSAEHDVAGMVAKIGLAL